MLRERVRSAILSTFFASLLLFASSGAAAGAEAAPPPCGPATQFDRNNFSNSTKIDNKWAPLVPGTQFVLEGRANRGGGSLPHRVVTTVTDLTKMVNGVRAVVLWERDINEGQLSEAELAFQAQDNAGNVWNLGEYPEEYENGKFIGAPSTWIAGLARAEPGNLMLAEPREGAPEYLQGWAPEVDFLDCAKVFMAQQKTCVPASCYENVLVTDERSPLDPGSGHQRKYYAPGVGNVQVGAVGDPEGETLVLVEVTRLSADALAEARQEALKLEKNAYEGNALYRQTSPAEQASVAQGPVGGQVAQASPSPHGDQGVAPQGGAPTAERGTAPRGLPVRPLLLGVVAVALLGVGVLLVLRRRGRRAG